MNYRQEWAEGDIEAGTLLDAIEELQNEVIKLKNDKREYVRLALQAEAEQQQALLDRAQLAQAMRLLREAKNWITPRGNISISIFDRIGRFLEE